eukprot:CAMPEP_0195644216 /NCGR_PEP_ID=MMETSP0815-20121206/28261_1 /TAXON_ID=97485 /ORGANISM="Prymnesium parvum, Strain Texoma1" /LENGTH=45 /DNA_ID= /DNA_START= /DNA_END= /DNA_ORIENTATION=
MTQQSTGAGRRAGQWPRPAASLHPLRPDWKQHAYYVAHGALAPVR